MDRKLSSNYSLGKIIFKILLSTIILVSLLIFIDWKEIIVTIKKADIQYIYLCIFISIVLNIILVPYRWRRILSSVDVLIEFKTILKYRLITFPIKAIIPSFLGDLIKSYLISSDTKEPKNVVMSTIVIEKLIILESDVILFILLFIVAFYSRKICLYLIPIILLILIFPLIIKFLNICNRWKITYCDTIRKLMNKYQNISLKHHYENTILALLIESISILLLYFCLKSVGFNLKITGESWKLCLAVIAGGIPISFGGLGVRDFTLLSLLNEYTEVNTILSGTILYFFIEMGMMEIISIPYTFHYVKKIKIFQNRNGNIVMNNPIKKDIRYYVE